MQVVISKRVVIAILLSIWAVGQYIYMDSDIVKQENTKVDNSSEITKKTIFLDNNHTDVLQVSNKDIAVNHHRDDSLIEIVNEQESTSLLEEIIDDEDYFHEPKAFNQDIDFIQPTEIVNVTSEYERDVLRQLTEYEDPK